MADERTNATQQQIDEYLGVRGDEVGPRFLYFLSRTRHPFDRDAGPAHITGSAIVVSQAGVLLHQHRREAKWLQPGGHVDAGETPWDAAVRETFEETGIHGGHPGSSPYLLDLDIHETSAGHTHLDMRYLLLAEGVAPSPPAGESQEVEWFDWERAVEVTRPDPKLVRSIERAEVVCKQLNKSEAVT